jgi:hypothetical protein
MPVDRASVLYLFQHEIPALTRDTCSKGIGKSYGRANQLLTELWRIGILRMQPGDTTLNQPNQYFAAEEFRTLIQTPILSLNHVKDLSGA